MKRRAFFLGLGGSALLTASCRPVCLPEVRALWISRFDYQSPEDIASVMRQAAEIGFTDIFFQVRAKGTVYYPSRHEPWAYELTSFDPADTGVDPGWNPLQTAVDEARQNGLLFHAYLNVLPGWHGSTGPAAASDQHWVKHPDWFMVDRVGVRMNSERWYSFLNPSHPEVIRHLKRLVRELSSFPLDGIHLDYIRYPDDFHDFVSEVFPEATADELKAHCDFSYDPFSLDQFGRDPSVYPVEWDRFRRESVTRLVSDLSGVVREENPEIVVSASIVARPDKRPETFQQGLEWGRRKLLDWVVPMMYSAHRFEETLNWNIQRLGACPSRERMVVGLYARHETEELLAQIRLARSAGVRGVSLFSCADLISEHKKTAKGEALCRFFTTG